MTTSTKTEVISVKVTPEVKDKIKQIAAEKDVTMSKLLNRILENYLKEVKNGGSELECGYDCQREAQ